MAVLIELYWTYFYQRIIISIITQMLINKALQDDINKVSIYIVVYE